jgi:protein O-GlcNAc transferase
VITFQRKRANRRILNEPDLLALLATYGTVRVVEFNASTPFAAQLGVMRDTGVYVSAHTSNLANAVFLQPGSAVVEIIQVGVGGDLCGVSGACGSIQCCAAVTD